MISSDLLRYKIDYKNKKIHPLLCPLDNNSAECQLSIKIIEIFNECYNNKSSKEKLNYMTKLLEHTYKDYKLVRGLYSILEKKCIFKSVFEDDRKTDVHNNFNFSSKKDTVKKLTPADLRRMVFEESALSNVATTESKRNEIIGAVSNKLEIDTGTTLRLMWSDLEENTVIYNFNPPDPLILLFQYNISLIQTLLFNCLKIEIKIDSSKSIGSIWKDILRQVKRLGLMYWLEINPDKTGNIICTVEGASNVINLTERYGNSIAKLIPLIFKADDWSLKADILKTTNNGNKTIYDFEISKSRYSDKISFETPKASISKYGQQIGGKNNAEKKTNETVYNAKSTTNNDRLFMDNFENNSTISYDSNIEKTFAQKFELFSTGWSIEREPEPLISKSKTAFISDFILTKHENKVLVEIIGFWTSEYLERKIQKIAQVIENYNNNNFYMILIVNFENLAMYETNHTHHLSNIKNKSNVLIISYKNQNIPFKEIIPFLKTIEKKYTDKNFEDKIDKNRVLQEINAILNKFRGSPMTHITLRDLNETLKSNQNEIDPIFNLEEIVGNNSEFKGLIEGIIKSNELIIVKDTIFKETSVRENCKELRDKKIENLKDACDFLTIKRISERIQIDLLIFMGFKIYWNGLDYSESKIVFSEQ